jgi:Aminoglycoside-2''-adenylyltransferase
MTSSALLELLRHFEAADIEIWLDGGWGVDALLGVQTRPHDDVDIIARVSDLHGIRAALQARGFAEQPGGSPGNFVLADATGLEVDIHAVRFDEKTWNGCARVSPSSCRRICARPRARRRSAASCWGVAGRGAPGCRP